MTKREVKAIARDLLDSSEQYIARNGDNESCWIVGKILDMYGRKLMKIVDEKRRGAARNGGAECLR